MEYKLEPENIPENIGFKCEYFGLEMVLSPEEKRLRELALEYHERAEAYDRTVCSDINPCNRIVPVTAQQFSLVNRNARKIRDELFSEVEKLGFNYEQWKEAIFNASRLS